MSAPSRGDRVIHQDYIARIRYENALPPPPGAPKLLDIPMEGLNYYTSAAFATRMARQQPLNIEADAELGMPIDLVGMPGIFDGDESGRMFPNQMSLHSHDLTVTTPAIQAPLSLPPVHPKDKPLLRPLSELGKPKYGAGGHSFLRRTEYIAPSSSYRSLDNSVQRNAVKPPSKKCKQIDTSKDDPVNVLRATLKGFDIAYPQDAYTGPDGQGKIKGLEPTPAEAEAWKRPKHPIDPGLKLLDSYPLLPDLDAIPDQGSYNIVKFTTNPTQATEAHDTRMDVGLLTYLELSPQAQAIIQEDYEAKLAAHQADPMRNPMPGPMFSYRFFLPQNEQGMNSVKRKLEGQDGDHDDPEKDSDQIRFDHVRAYDTSRAVMNGDFLHKEVALALYDPQMEGRDASYLPKAAYYYPLSTKLQLKPRRNKNLTQLGLGGRPPDEDEEIIDGVYVSVREPDDAVRERRNGHLQEIEPSQAQV